MIRVWAGYVVREQAGRVFRSMHNSTAGVWVYALQVERTTCIRSSILHQI